MDRAEATGLGFALAGHAALLAALSLGFAAAVRPPMLNQPMEVSFVDEVALTSASPDPTPIPAQSVAPETGPPEQAAPVPEIRVAAPAPPLPQPSIKPVPVKPAPEAITRKAVTGVGKAEAPRGSRLGANFLKGIGRDPSPARAQSPPGAVMNAQAASNIGSAIQRQIQPCADRQVNPGPGANRIRTRINLRLARDGSLAARPRVLGQSGVDDENSRYAERVSDLAIAAFTGCSPLRGLPGDLYDVPNGWSNFTLNFKLPG